MTGEEFGKKKYRRKWSWCDHGTVPAFACTNWRKPPKDLRTVSILAKIKMGTSQI